MSTYVGYRDNGKTNEQGLKEELNRLFTKGVAMVDTPTSLAVSQRGAGANMSVDVAIGDAHLVLPSGLYSYWGWTDAVTNVSVTAANVSNPRIDVVVAYVDLSVTSTTNSNNPGALKFSAVAGTAAGSPTAPSDSTIQSTLGAGVPFIKLAQIAVAANATQVVNANLTDIRQPISVKGRLWGGTSNTSGHTVPNAADDTVVLAGATQSLTNKTFANNSVKAANLDTAAITLASVSTTTAQSGITATPVIVTGLTSTVTIPSGGRTVRIEAFVPDFASSAISTWTIAIYNSATVTGSPIQKVKITQPIASGAYNAYVFYEYAPSAGSQSYCVAISCDAGTGATGLNSTEIAYLTVKVV